MKKLFVAAFLATTATNVAASCDGWTKTDTVLEGTYLALHVADWAQTRWKAEHDRERGAYEKNPFLGRHPSVGRVNSYFIATALGHVGVSCLLPHGKWRNTWFGGTIALELKVTHHNYQAGVRMNW